MRKIGLHEIENIAVGAAVLGTGGGGDPHIGKLMAKQAIKEFGPIEVLTMDELDEEALVVPAGMMGAPTVLVEKAPSGKEASAAFEALENYLGKSIQAVIPFEIGGVNSMIPLALAARLQLPVVDGDGMGRAFPEMQMKTFSIEGISATPLVLADEKGNSAILNHTISNLWAERLARNLCTQMGGSATVAMYSMNGTEVKAHAIFDTLTFAETIGKSLYKAKQTGIHPIEEVRRLTGGFQLFEGKVVDIHRVTEGGFAKGTASFEGLNAYADSSENLTLHFQNEHLLAKRGEEVLCVTPDLITVLDAETGFPITTEGLRYGQRCVVLGIPCNEKWRSSKGIQTVGPQYFGYDVSYQPVEELVSGKGWEEE